MLDRRGWFNAKSKNWFFCGVSNIQVIGCKKLIWRERKKSNLAGAEQLAGTKNWAPTKTNFAGTNRCPDKN